MTTTTTAKISEMIRQADWKTEKHVPVIECPDTVRPGEMFDVTVTLGKEVAHPNTTEHHIRWIDLYFHEKDAKAPYHVARFGFCAHGESVEGPNQGSVYTHHCGATRVKIGKPGVLQALAYCNIHGLWESTREVKVSQ